MSNVTLTPPTKKKDDTLLIINRLLDFMTRGEVRPRFMTALALRVIGLLGVIAVPYFTGQAINVISEPGGTLNALWRWALYAFIAGVLYIALSIVAERLFSDLATRALYKLQRRLFEHMQTLSLNFFDRQPVGELMSRVTNDTETVALFYESAVAQMIRAI
ncbi:MAG: hypothetical protein KDJ65_30020, partial [Anaerolineae bacterium]|nr:hypothetical protein [Anaerolineae bacterium]